MNSLKVIRVIKRKEFEIVFFPQSCLKFILLILRDKHRRMIFQLVTADFFEILMQFIIVLNVVPIAFDFAVDETWENETKWSDVLKVTLMISRKRNFLFS